MKKLEKLFALSSLLLVISACSSTTSPDLTLNQEQTVTAQSKESVYPFEVNKDFYPLYNSMEI
jgi:Tfp pilus assembly protein PilP